MKKCVRCGQTYSDDTLNFCLNDGELLVNFQGDEPKSLFPDEPPPTQFSDDSPPTLMLDRARITNQTSWQQPSAPPPAPWQGPGRPAPSYVPGAFTHTRDQTLPTISLVLGIIACFMVCCAGGIWLGLPAAVLGYLGMKNADSDPNRYGGRGLAVAGMVLGIVTFVASMFFIIIGNIS
jgi:hypothetical protein